MTKKIIDAIVLSNHKIIDDIYQLDIHAPEAAECAFAGQFINVYLKDKSMLLPRPISICFTEGDMLTLVYRVVGKGTAALTEYQEGDGIRISSPLGNGFQIEDVFANLQNSGVIALVGGGLGVPPMLDLAKQIRKQIDEQVQLIAVLGFMQEPFLADRFHEYCDDVLISTEAGSIGFRGNVLELIKANHIKADYYLSCGPKPMLKALAAYCQETETPVQVSMEERMGCGYGACVGCVCKTVSQYKKVCKDGPVFFGNEVIWDE